MNCSTISFSYFDSWQFQATLSHLLVCFTFPFNIFGAYCIVRKTPNRYRKAKWFLLNLHCWTILTDLLIAALLTPYMFFPVFVGIPVGLLGLFGVNAGLQTFFAQLGLGGLATSIVMIFENRHNNLVRGRWKINNDYIRYAFYAWNGVYSIIFLLPCYYNIPEPNYAKIQLLKVIPCPHPDYYLDTVFVFSMDISSVTQTAGIYLIFMVFEASVLCFHSLYYLMRLNHNISNNTRKLQKQFFINMLVQVSVPVFVIVLPMTYCFYSVILEYYNQTLNNIAITFITFHGISSTATLICLNPSYRQFIGEIVCRTKPTAGRRNSSPISVVPTIFSRN